jgi:hypothetical protein
MTITDLPRGDEAAGHHAGHQAQSALPGKGGLARIAAAALNSRAGCARGW